jgi:hypothetical protein
MLITIQLINRLLADIRVLTGVAISVPDGYDMSWFIIDGPKLDKQILGYLEGHDLSVEIPEWLEPLWQCFRNGNIEALRYLRTVLTFCYKAETEPTNEQLQEAQKAFEDVEASVGVWDLAFNGNSPTPYLRLVRASISSIIYRADWRSITPSHGPGAVFPSRAPSEKCAFEHIYPSIDALYPADSFFCSQLSLLTGDMEGELARREYRSSIVSKLVAVPKDSRGPRLICVHPAEAIWIQQGQRKVLQSIISQHPLTRGKINFHDQTVNGKIALTSSRTREYFTLDLKEASDRISDTLVRYLFGDAYRYLGATRAEQVQLLY